MATPNPGAKARLILEGLTARLKSCPSQTVPFPNPRETALFSTLEAVPFHSGLGVEGVLQLKKLAPDFSSGARLQRVTWGRAYSWALLHCDCNRRGLLHGAGTSGYRHRVRASRCSRNRRARRTGSGASGLQHAAGAY